MRSLDLLTPQQALRTLLDAIDAARTVLPSERIQTISARDRVLADDVISPVALPEFRRSTVDGYAVKASSTPGVLRVVGEVRMGELSPFVIRAAEAGLVHTGGNVPEGADAVVMLEHTRPLDVSTSKIQTTGKLQPGENVIRAGEDVNAGEVVVAAGTRLREQEIAGLLSLGIVSILVRKRPRVALIPSGDELVAPELPTKPGQVRNTNAPMLAALVQRHGGDPWVFDPLPDRRTAFEQAAASAMAAADMVLFMAGSSVGERDFVPEVVNGMGAPGLLAHGVLFRPGKPTLFAVANGKPVLGLPGNPISALVTGMIFGMPALAAVQGMRNPPEPSYCDAFLAEDMRSPRDLEHWFPVQLESNGTAPPRAIPISTKSNLIFGLVRAAGMACAPIGVDKVTAGSLVRVRLLN
jgi:molybdopterin molybdotransferase